MRRDRVVDDGGRRKPRRRRKREGDPFRFPGKRYLHKTGKPLISLEFFQIFDAHNRSERISFYIRVFRAQRFQLAAGYRLGRLAAGGTEHAEHQRGKNGTEFLE